ncbi:MAG: formylmethanofuran dehydrogenase [Methanosphaera sp. SHI613]|nr:MAG: formylmethanofuran dehydrogenase [Methanosphaera sp. SHI613]
MLGTVAAADVANDNATLTTSDVATVDNSDVMVTSETPNAENSIADSQTETSEKNVNVKVDYQYADDAKVVTPDFYIFSNGTEIKFNRSLNSKNEFTLKFNDSILNNEYNITAMTSGYNSESKVITSTDKTVTFKLTATEAYKLGRDVTIAADKALNFNGADDVLVVTSAGVARLNNKTTEEAIEGILNYGSSKIAYTDILMLRDSAVDPIDFAFIVKQGKDLKVVVYENASTKYSYLGTISKDMTKQQWNDYLNALSGKNAWSFASLANGWAAGVSREVLQEAAFHGHICEGTLGGYSIVQALLKYYPPVQETSMGGGSPGDITSYKILGVPGGSDDDAAMFFLDATVGKIGYVGIDTTATGATENMIGFIRWFSNDKTGDLIIMTFDSNKTKADFTKETGINPDDGSLEELQYDTWWINKINKSPEDLVTFLYEFTGLNEEQYYYLMGTASDVVQDEDHSIEAIDSHGLDMEYILSLNLPKAKRTTTTANVGSLSDVQMKNIGVKAANKGRELFEQELGIDIFKDDMDFAVFTSAGYVYLEGQETVLVRDGLYETLGKSLYSKDMLQYHQALWKPLWFAFIMRNPNSDDVYAAYLRYNPDGTFFVGDLNGSKVVNIGIDTLNDSEKLAEIQKTFMPDGNWFSIQTIANAWKSNPNFDQIMSFLYHNHVCPGVQPGFFITDYVQKNYPLNENQSYTYIASSTYCKDDSLTYILGISPGMGTFIVQKLPNSETESTYVEGGTDEGVLVVWDDVKKVGKAAIITFKWPVIDTSMYSTSEAKRATQIQAFIDMHKGNKNDKVVEDLVVKASEEKYINEEQFNLLKSGSGDLNTMTFIKSLPALTEEEVMAQNAANQNTTDESNNNQNDTNTNNDNQQNNNNQPNNNQQNTNNNRPTSNTNRYSNPRSSTSSSPNTVSVGTTAQATAALAEDTEKSEDNKDSQEETPESSESPEPSSGKAYEVSQNTPTNNNSMNILYFAGSLILVGGLAGYGFLRYRKH